MFLVESWIVARQIECGRRRDGHDGEKVGTLCWRCPSFQTNIASSFGEKEWKRIAKLKVMPFSHCRRLCNTTGFLLFGLNFEMLRFLFLENGLLTQCIALTGRSPVHTPMCFSDTTSPILGNGSRNRDPSKLIRLSWATGTEYAHKIRLYSGQIPTPNASAPINRLFSSQILDFNFSQQFFFCAHQKNNKSTDQSLDRKLFTVQHNLYVHEGKNIHLHNNKWVTTFCLSGIFQLRLILTRLIEICIQKASNCTFLLTLTCRHILVLFIPKCNKFAVYCVHRSILESHSKQTKNEIFHFYSLIDTVRFRCNIFNCFAFSFFYLLIVIFSTNVILDFSHFFAVFFSCCCCCRCRYEI